MNMRSIVFISALSTSPALGEPQHILEMPAIVNIGEVADGPCVITFDAKPAPTVARLVFTGNCHDLLVDGGPSYGEDGLTITLPELKTSK